MGTIGLSTKKKNRIYSNVVGCAAYYGNNEVLRHILINDIDGPEKDQQAKEVFDEVKSITTKLIHEYHNYTPLMLAITVGDSNLDCVQTLLEYKVNYHCEDDLGNSIIHIAAINKCNKILAYLLENLDLNLFKWNKAS